MVGSVEYSVGHLHTNLVLVLGHTRCGAIAGATSTALNKKAEAQSNEQPSSTLEKLLNGLAPVALQAAAELPAGASVDEVAAHAVKVNVFHTIEKLLTYSKPLREKVNQGEVVVQGAIYDIVTGNVEFLGRCPRQALVLDAAALRAAREEPNEAPSGKVKALGTSALDVAKVAGA
jgi:carbonic anhydrase